jgi:sulfur-carrier protein adenylyltransferase/sulfurtransferase
MQQVPGEPFARLAPAEAKRRVDSGELHVVDVREQWEFARDHIPEATLTPLGQIIARPADVITQDDVLFVCEVGQRSAVAAEMAAALGMKKVYNLEGGMQAWRSAGLPTAA